MNLFFQPFPVYNKVLHLPNPCHGALDMTKKALMEDKGKLAILFLFGRIYIHTYIPPYIFQIKKTLRCLLSGEHLAGNVSHKKVNKFLLLIFFY